MNIFVGNLLFEATEGDVKKLFEGFGNVASVVIVMSKEKKTPKSRGFGFVQMPDEQQAFAAIAALNGKEFMGRVLDVNPARPKVEAQAENKFKEKRQPEAYKGGRYTHGYMKRRGSAGMREEARPWKRPQGDARPWKKPDGAAKFWKKPLGDAKPWQKSSGEHKPWKKTEGEARPWKKAEGRFKPWKKPDGAGKFWKKPLGDAKPWQKSSGEHKPWHKPEGGVKPWQKAKGEARTWKRPQGDAKPWKKPVRDAKPWSKGSERPQKSRFNPSVSPGMARGNDGRSRTKVRRKPGGYKR